MTPEQIARQNRRLNAMRAIDKLAGDAFKVADMIKQLGVDGDEDENGTAANADELRGAAKTLRQWATELES